MDWTKAKTILIIALLITNIFLLVTYSVLQDNNEQSDEDLQLETIALLESKNIYVKDSLPIKHDKMPVLIVEHDRIDPYELQQYIWEQIPLDESKRSREGSIKLAENFLKRCGLWSSNVELDRVEQEGQRTFVHFKNVYNGIRIEKSYIICTIEDGQIIEVERSWLNPVEFGRTKKATMSASAALISLMSQKHELESILVEDMEMVYWLEETDYVSQTTISDTAFPAWKITYNSGQTKYVPAYND
jgi:regulatory protein YycI of two-component signal transduction system YycFG